MQSSMVKLVVYPKKSCKFWHRSTVEVEVENNEDLATILPRLVKKLTADMVKQLETGAKSYWGEERVATWDYLQYQEKIARDGRLVGLRL